MPSKRIGSAGLDAGHQLARRERFDDVIISACAESGEPVGFLAARGEEDHGGVISRQGADATHDLDPVEARQHDVEDHQRRSTLARLLERARPVAGDGGLVARARQVAGHDLRDRRLVLDNEHGNSGGVGLGVPVRPAQRLTNAPHLGSIVSVSYGLVTT
jgi:hypothetical protein